MKLWVVQCQPLTTQKVVPTECPFPQTPERRAAWKHALNLDTPAMCQHIAMSREPKSKLSLLCPHSEPLAEKPVKQKSDPGLVLPSSNRAEMKRHPPGLCGAGHQGLSSPNSVVKDSLRWEWLEENHILFAGVILHVQQTGLRGQQGLHRKVTGLEQGC